MTKQKKFKILYKLYKQLHRLYMEHNSPYKPYYAYDYLKGTIAVDYRCNDEGYKRYLAKSEQIRVRLKRVSKKLKIYEGAYKKNKGLG